MLMHILLVGLLFTFQFYIKHENAFNAISFLFFLSAICLACSSTPVQGQNSGFKHKTREWLCTAFVPHVKLGHRTLKRR